MLLAAGSAKLLGALVWQTGKNLGSVLSLSWGLQALQMSTTYACLDTCLSCVHVDLVRLPACQPMLQGPHMGKAVLWCVTPGLSKGAGISMGA